VRGVKSVVKCQAVLEAKRSNERLIE